MKGAVWITEMRNVGVLEVACEFELDHAPPRLRSGGVLYTCPVCGATRPHGRRHSYGGATGVGVRRDGLGWKCFACDATGDALDLVALCLGGRRFRKLDAARKAEVKAWCVRYLKLAAESGTRHFRVAHSTPAPSIAADYPPDSEVRALWESAFRVDWDRDVSAFLLRRGLDPTALADRDLVRAIASQSALPSWAKFESRSWHAAGYRMLTLWRDETGAARSITARQVFADASGPKSVAPSGHARGGLVFACELGRRVLAYGCHPSRWPVERASDAPFAIAPAEWWPASESLIVVVVEGEPDALTWTTEYGDAAEHPPAVLGLVAGAWTRAIADRIPDGSHVVIATDHDDQGEKYARHVVQTFDGRAVEISRWRAPLVSEAS